MAFTGIIPGGHPEDGESPEDALRREVREETCCEVIKLTLLGWQHVRDLQDDSVHYQMRYYCRVRVKPFEPQYEICLVASRSAQMIFCKRWNMVNRQLPRNC